MEIVKNLFTTPKGRKQLMAIIFAVAAAFGITISQQDKEVYSGIVDTVVEAVTAPTE